MPCTCLDCKVELEDKTGNPNKCSRIDRVLYILIPKCHNCRTWGPSYGGGDNAWYEREACEGCKRRLVEGRFEAAHTSPEATGKNLKALAAEMKGKLAQAEEAEAAAAKAKAESEARAKREAEQQKARAEAAERAKAQADEEAKRKAEEEARKKVQEEAEAKIRAEALAEARAEAAKAREEAAQVGRQSLWRVAGAALSQTAQDVQSLAAEVVPSVHADLISAARAVMERRSSTECEAAAAAFEAAEQRVRAARNHIAEALERSKEEEVDGKLTREREEAVGVLVERGAKLVGMRGHEQAAAEDRLARLRQHLIASAHVIRAALPAPEGPPPSTQEPEQVLTTFLETYDGWMVRLQDKAAEGRARTEQAMSDLVGSLRSFTDVLEQRQPASALPATEDYVGRLAGAMAEEQALVGEACADYAEAVHVQALAAGTALVDKLKREEHSLLQLLAAFEAAARVVAIGPDPAHKLLERLDGLQTKYEEAEEMYTDARHEMEKLQKRRNASEDAKASKKQEVVEAGRVLSGVRSDIRNAWVEAYALAAGPYPELPVAVIRQCPSSFENLHSTDGGRLFCPCSKLEQYQDLHKLSAMGARHNVWRGVVSEDGQEVTVALKEFDLGPTTDGTAEEMRKKCRTMQREVDTLARLEHPNVIQVQLFFLQEDKNRLLCYVRFQLFPGGDMERWLASEEGKERSKVQVVLLDALRGLEHVHYHGIVHCDVKPANVLLTEVQRDGHRRAVLADFELSLDQQQRRQQMSMLSSGSMVTGGVRGTPGLLTLAPEVRAGGKEPTGASDMFSFGGMALVALFAEQAQAWLSRAPAELWAGDGRPRLEALPSLVSSLLARDPATRPSASQALADDWFAAMGVAEQRQAARQVEELVQEQQRFREEEAALAAAVQMQMTEMQRQKAAMAAEAESLAERRTQDAEKKKEDEARLRHQRQALEARATALASKEASVVAMIKSRIPPYWQHDGRGVHLEPTDSAAKSRMQEWIRKTVLGGANHQCGTPMLGCTVTRMLRVENGALWQMYQSKKEVLKAEHREWKGRGLTVPSLRCKSRQPAMPSVELSAELNELFLFHGTSHATAQAIADHGFDERVAALSGLYGAGSYFADCSCKSHQYARRSSTPQGEHVLLLCRVTMGWPLATRSQHTNQRRPPDNPALRNRPFDSIFAESGVGRGGQQEHNEFVVFDRNQVYPEYLIFYKL